MSGNPLGNININQGMNMRPNYQMNMPLGMPMQNMQMNPNNHPMNPMFPPMTSKFDYGNNLLDFGMPQMPIFNPMMSQFGNPMHSIPVAKPVEIKKVWVSHIPPSLSDTFMLKLLETCGPVASWKRTTDQNGRPKGFGFCEFATVEGMLKALRLLNHLKLEEGYELAVSIK
jgi:hypothetical protein